MSNITRFRHLETIVVHHAWHKGIRAYSRARIYIKGVDNNGATNTV